MPTTPPPPAARRRPLSPDAYAAILRSNFLEAAVTARGRPIALADGLAHAVALARRHSRGGRKIVFIGNGGSAAIASHMSTDYWKVGHLRAVAFNDSSLLTCIGNDYGYPCVFEKPVEMFARRGDLLVAISSSGRSENILRGVAAARRRGASVMTLSGFAPDNPLRGLGDLNFYVSFDDYGPVEIAHLTLLHYVLDRHVATRASRR